MSELNFELLQENIRVLLKKHDLTQNALAEIAGMTQANVSKALNRNESKQFTIDQVFRIAHHFGVSIDELCGNKAAEDASMSPATMLALVTKLLCNTRIRIIDVTEQAETVYTPCRTSDGFPDCAIEQIFCDYHAFYFPDYFDCPPALSDEEKDDLQYECYCNGNESEYKAFNEVLRKFLPVINLYREGSIQEEAFQMVYKGYLEQLKSK